jgi:hypothetical protein
VSCQAEWAASTYMRSVSAWKFANMKVFSDAMSGSFGMGLPQTSREGFIGGSGTCRTSYLHSGTLCDPFWYLLTTTHGLPGIFGLQLDDDRNGQLTLGFVLFCSLCSDSANTIAVVTTSTRHSMAIFRGTTCTPGPLMV